MSNLVKEVCEYWNNKEEWETTKDLSGVFGLDRTSIINYLKKGNKLEFCKYSAKDEMRKNAKINGRLNAKRVEVFRDNISLGTFDSITEIEKESEKIFGVKLLNSNISAVCKGRQKQHKGFTFKYV